MWDRDYRRAARRALRDQRRASRQAFRAARRGYRYNYYARGPFPFLRILLIILFAPLILQLLGWHAFFPLMPLIIIGIFVFIWLRNSSMSGSRGSSGSTSNYQQPNQYYQPPQQPYQPNQYYQPSQQPDTSGASPYQPYEQGYQTPPQDAYQQGVQPYQSNPPSSTSEQYEEPQVQYPQEMPPMV